VFCFLFFKKKIFSISFAFCFYTSFLEEEEEEEDPCSTGKSFSSRFLEGSGSCSSGRERDLALSKKASEQEASLLKICRRLHEGCSVLSSRKRRTWRKSNESTEPALKKKIGKKRKEKKRKEKKRKTQISAKFQPNFSPI